MTEGILYINGHEVDLPDPLGLGIRIYKSFFDFENVTRREGDRSLDIELPYTRTNNEIFNNLSSITAFGKFNSTQNKSFRYTVGGSTVLKGTAVHSKLPRGGFKVELLADNIAWAEQLRGKSIRDLTGFDSITYIGSRSYGIYDPVDSLTQPDIWLLSDADQSDICFGLCAYGNYYREGSTASGETARVIDNVEREDIPGGVFLTNIIKQIFAEINMSASGSLLTNEELKRNVIPYMGDGLPEYNWGLLAQSATGNSGTSNFIGAFNEDYNSGFTSFWKIELDDIAFDFSQSMSDTNFTYRVPVNGIYSFSVSEIITLLKDFADFFAPGAANYERSLLMVAIIPDDVDELGYLLDDANDYIELNSAGLINPNIIAAYDFGTGATFNPYDASPITTGGTYSQFITGTLGNTGSQLNGSGVITMLVEDVPLNKEDQIGFFFVSHTPHFGVPHSDTEVTVSSSLMVTQETSLPIFLNPAKLLPDIDQLDLITWWLRLYCGVFEVQENSIVFEPWQDSYQPNVAAVDLSISGNADFKSERPLNHKRRTTFQYSLDTSDFFLQKYGNDMFSQSIDTDNSHADSGEEVITSGFAATMEREYQYKSLSGPISKLIIPTIADSSTLNQPQNEVIWSYGYTPRILKYIGLQSGTWEYDNTELSEYPALRFSSDETGGNSLSFRSNYAPIHSVDKIISGSHSNPGLYAQYWEKLQHLRMNTYVCTAPFKLSLAQWLQLRTDKKIYFADVLWYILSLENGYDPVRDPVKGDGVEIQLVRSFG